MARRMVGIAFDLGRTSQMAGYDQTRGVAAHLHRGSVVHRHTRDEFFRLAHVGNDGFLGQLGARGNTGERHRRRHQLQEIAPVGGVQPVGSTVGKLVLDEGLELLGLGQLLQALPVQRPLG